MIVSPLITFHEAREFWSFWKDCHSTKLDELKFKRQSIGIPYLHEGLALSKRIMVMDQYNLSISIFLYYLYKKLKQLKSFLTKIMPTVPLTEAPLVRPKGLTKGRGRLVFSIFFTKILILFTPVIFYTHLLYSRITFI